MDRIIGLPSQECRLVALPRAIDDDCILATGFLPQPASRVPVIIGFRASVSIYRSAGRLLCLSLGWLIRLSSISVLGDIIALQRSLRHSTDLDAQSVLPHLRRILRFNEEVQVIVDQLPKELVLKKVPDSATGR